MPSDSEPGVDILSRVPLLAGLKSKHLKSIVESGRRSRYDAGEKIVKKGEEGDTLYLILDGEVEVRSGSRVLSNLEKGDFFGEIALLDNRPRTADIVATVPTSCLGITSRSFERIIQKDPQIIQVMMTELARRLRKANIALME